MAVIIGATWIFGLWGLVFGIVIAVLVATGKIKTGLEPKDSSKQEVNNQLGKGKMNKKTLGGCILVIVFITALVLIINSITNLGNSSSKISTPKSSTNVNTPSTDTKNKVLEAPKGKVEVKSDTLKTLYGYKKIVGEVMNNTAREANFVKITATYYDKDGKVTGTDSAYAGDTISTPLAVGATAPFDITSLDTSLVVDHYKLDVTWN